MNDTHFRYVLKLVVIFAVYFTTARIGLSLDAVNGFATLVWPPTGIALATILILGYRFWPSIALGAFLVNLDAGAQPFVAIGICIGNTLEALLGAYLLKRFGSFQNSLERVRDILGLVLFAALVSTLVSATIGVTSLLLGNIVTSATYGATWIAWWVGDMLGTLVIAPLILVWSSLPRVLKMHRFAEASIPILLLVAVSIFAFHEPQRFGFESLIFAYTIFPILIWVALRFGQRGSVTATFVVSVIAVWSTIDSFNPLAGNTLSHSLLILQSFIAITAVTFMVMAAVVSERVRTLKHQQALVQKTTLLTKQRSHLLALNQAKDEFISLASHELRTPATGVKQYIGMLLENYAGELTKAQHTMLYRAHESNERQIQVINDLLNVAQIDAGKVVLKQENVDFAALVADVLHEQATTFTTRNQAVSFTHGSGHFVAPGDRVKLRMALENIISNASKYTPAGKKLEVKLRKNKSNLLVVVKDNGIGISKKDFSKLFKKFSRINNPLSASVGGTGLGLYLAKKIIDLHRGSITVASKPKQGSTFTITLPRGKGGV